MESGPDEAPLSPSDLTPARTAFVGDKLALQFKDSLVRLSMVYARQRGSLTMTEADVHRAFYALTSERRGDAIRRIAGDGAVLVGGVLLGLVFSAGLTWQSVVIGLSGAMLATIGLCVREALF